MKQENIPIASIKEADRIIKEIDEILGHQPSDNTEAMSVDEAMAFADEWTLGTTFYHGKQGWKVVCATLAAEVRRLRAETREECGFW